MRRPRTPPSARVAAVAAALLAAGLVVPAEGSADATVRADRGQAAARQPPAVIGPRGVQHRVIGHSVRHRPINAFRLGDPDSGWTVVAIGAMHGDEPQSRRPLEHLRDHRPVHGVDLWVIPVLNPDGYHRGTRKNSHGVDLNRNFPVRWKDLDGGYESGPGPASEPETRVALEFLRRIDPDRMISLHQPFFNVDAKSSKLPRFSRQVANEMRIPLGDVDCGGVCHGTMTQWFNKRLDGASITVELAAAPSRSYLTGAGPNGLLREVGARC